MLHLLPARLALTKLFAKASALSEKERATLAGLLMESLESEFDPDVEEAWPEEIERRVAEWISVLLPRCHGKHFEPGLVVRENSGHELTQTNTD